MTNNDKIKLITKQFKQKVEKKYNIIDMKLFGSSARLEQTKESDIDIMVKLPKVNREIEEDLFDMAYDLELEHDCQIDVIVLSEEFNHTIPLYKHIEKEGIAI
ncbi:MAG: nucleotidyltransferase domain-containing protein [candidate division KSB1 bacterium]|nr:nucleotidyltransferase domain-containing protein [candidate division KSB1 bacterium]